MKHDNIKVLRQHLLVFEHTLILLQARTALKNEGVAETVVLENNMT